MAPFLSIARLLTALVVLTAGLATTSRAQEAEPPPTAEPSSGIAPPRALKIKGTAAELRSFGVAVDASGIEPFPNSCDGAGNRKPAISVSNEMLDHFRERGFSLTSLCLALGSRVRFNPETGEALPRFVVSDLPETEVTLNVPDCFKNAMSLVECDNKFAGWTRYEYEPDEAADRRESGREVAAMLTEYVANTGKSGVLWSNDATDSDLHTLAGPTYEWVVASPELGSKVGYALQNREDEDPVPEEEVDTETGKTEHGGMFGWLFGSR